MATTKSSNLTTAQGKLGKKVASSLQKAKLRETKDLHAYTAGQLAAAEVLITNCTIPSNAIVTEVLIYNDDLDSNGAPTLALDFGYAASEDFVSVTSGTETKNNVDSVLDADALVDGDTTAQAATTKFTSLALDAVTRGASEANELAYETLGYDEDPKTDFKLAITVATGAATAAAGSLAVLVRYTAND